MEVEREVVDLHRALLMRSRLGDTFEGTVTAIVGAGVYVNIEDPFVDVLVRMESLGPDAYEIDDEGLRVIGRRSGDRIAIGDAMLVQIEDVAILRRSVYGRRLAGGPVSDEPKPRRPRRDAADARPTRRVKISKSTKPAKGIKPSKRTKGGKSAKVRKKQR
jgi:ribonuclease R